MEGKRIITPCSRSAPCLKLQDQLNKTAPTPHQTRTKAVFTRPLRNPDEALWKSALRVLPEVQHDIGGPAREDGERFHHDQGIPVRVTLSGYGKVASSAEIAGENP